MPSITKAELKQSAVKGLRAEIRMLAFISLFSNYLSTGFLFPTSYLVDFLRRERRRELLGKNSLRVSPETFLVPPLFQLLRFHSNECTREGGPTDSAASVARQ